MIYSVPCSDESPLSQMNGSSVTVQAVFRTDREQKSEPAKTILTFVSQTMVKPAQIVPN
jgi:hypothetical protein